MAQNLTKSVATLLVEANASIRTLTIDEARAMHGSDDVLFIDLRDVRVLTGGPPPSRVASPPGWRQTPPSIRQRAQ